MDFLQPCWVLCVIFNFLNWNTVYAIISCRNVRIPNGSSQLKSKGRQITFKCKKNFELVGVKFAICLPAGQWSQKIPTCVGTSCQKPDVPPNVTVEELYKGGVLKFSCAAGLTRIGPESVSCDGKKWSNDPPTCIEAMTMNCDFDKNDLCGWSQDNTDDFDWTWNKGETPTANTGPRFDHTTNSSEGHYLFMESSAPQKTGQKARIISPPYAPEKVKDMCLQFFYHMFGPDGQGEVGDLDVYIKPQSLESTMLRAAKQIFHLSGNQGDQWIRADAPIPQLTEPFNFVFQATRLKSWSGDIAIDDFQVNSCPAETTTEQAPSKKDDDNIDSQDPSDDSITDLQTPGMTTKRQHTAAQTFASAAERETKQQNEQPRSTTALAAVKTNTPVTSGQPQATFKASKIITPKSKATTTTKKTDVSGNNVDSSTMSFLVSDIPSTDNKVHTESPPQSKNNMTSKSLSSTPTVITTDISDDTEDNNYDDGKTNNTGNNDLNKKGDTNNNNEKSVITAPDYKDYDSIVPDSSSGVNRSSGINDSQAPFIDYHNNNKIDQNTATLSSAEEEDEILDGMIADAGAVKNSATPPGRIALLPLIIGIVSSVVVGVAVIAILAWIWVRSQRQKEEKDQDDQMNIITEYVETNLSV